MYVLRPITNIKYIFFTNIEYIFLIKIQLFVTAKSDQDPDLNWFGSLGPDSHRDKKRWIRVHIEANADPKH